MFTGIVEELGTVRSLAAAPGAGGAARLEVAAERVSEGARIGDSLAVNGCCLTVVALGPGWWAADVVAETLSRTNLGALAAGDPVNLERPVAIGDRLGGHLVQGHVDGVGELVSAAPDLHVRVPGALLPYLVAKGSVAVDGISLTVVEVTADGFSVAVIPHTLAMTTLGHKGPGDAVNLEADVVAKYVERLLGGGAGSPYTASGAGRP